MEQRYEAPYHKLRKAFDIATYGQEIVDLQDNRDYTTKECDELFDKLEAKPETLYKALLIKCLAMRKEMNGGSSLWYYKNIARMVEERYGVSLTSVSGYLPSHQGPFTREDPIDTAFNNYCSKYTWDIDDVKVFIAMGAILNYQPPGKKLPLEYLLTTKCENLNDLVLGDDGLFHSKSRDTKTQVILLFINAGADLTKETQSGECFMDLLPEGYDAVREYYGYQRIIIEDEQEEQEQPKNNTATKKQHINNGQAYTILGLALLAVVGVGIAYCYRHKLLSCMAHCGCDPKKTALAVGSPLDRMQALLSAVFIRE